MKAELISLVLKTGAADREISFELMKAVREYGHERYQDGVQDGIEGHGGRETT